MMLRACSLNIQGNIISFIRNKASNHGGAMALRNTNSNVNGKLCLIKNLAYWGGALSIILNGNFIIKGYALLDRNSAKDSGGALYIDYYVN